jgi:Ca2+-binding EF-hand superfamily protein
MSKITELIEETMQKMQKRGFEQGEAELFPSMLERSIKENSKRKEYHKPFTVFKWDPIRNEK